MSETDKTPREFWIIHYPHSKGYFEAYTFNTCNDKHFHVIEYSAHEKLQQQLDEAHKEIERLREALATK